MFGMALKNIINSSIESKNQNNNINKEEKILKKNISISKEEEKNEDEKKKEVKKEEEKKDNKKEEEKKEPPKSIKDNIGLFKNMFITNKNKATLEEIYKSLETAKNFEMSTLKNPPKFEEEKKGILDIGLSPLQKQAVNYPLSAIGLLKCDYGNGLVMYGTGALINLNMVLTCAHALYSPILKKRCDSAIFYLNLSNGKYLDSCPVETFVTPDEYEISQNEQYDYALCVLGEDIGKKGGYFGLCKYDEKEDKTGYIYGYSNIKSSKNFLSSFKTEVNEYEIMGVKSYLRYIEKEKILIYVGSKTKIGQDGSPIFKVIDDLNKVKIQENEEINKMKNIEKSIEEKKEEAKNAIISNIRENTGEKREIQKYDVKIFAIDCSMTSMILQAVDNLVLDNNENIMLNEMIYVRNHKALPIDDVKYTQILEWIKFYENIMPKGKIDKHIKNAKSSVYNTLYFNMLSGGLQQEKKGNLELSINCYDLRGKDLLMLFNSNFDISQLTKIDFSNNSITHEGMYWLSRQKSLCYNLIELNLSENLLNHKAAKYLTEEVEFNSLDIFDISKNEFGPLGASILSEKGKFPRLRVLNISDNHLLTEGAKGLSKGLGFHTIDILSISNNDINDYGFYHLSTGNLKKIKEIYLSGNKIGDEGMAYISNFKLLEVIEMDNNAITFKGVNNICGKYFEKIRKLNLDNNHIGVEGTYIIANYKQNNLKYLSLANNDICTKGAELISILNLMEIESINISDNFINDLGFYFLCKAKFKNLRELDVSLNKISDQGLVYITQAPFLETLNLLNLAGNDITDNGVKYISFCKMPELETLNLSVNYLKSKSGSYLSQSNFDLLSFLSLERNKIKYHGLKNLITSKFFENLIKLNLAYCKIGNEGCKILSEASTGKIMNLNLKDNGINDDGVIELCKGDLKSLKDLNLEDNDIGEDGINEIINTILKQLFYLRLKGNLRIRNKDLINIYSAVGSSIENDNNEHKYTFLNYSQINYGAIRYCIKHPEFMEKSKSKKK